MNNVSSQIHCLIHQHIKNTDDLVRKWYYDGGVQFSFQRVKYDYTYTMKDNSFWYSGTNKETYIDLGLDGVISSEYLIWKTPPMLLFTDGDSFIELADGLFKFCLEGGTDWW